MPCVSTLARCDRRLALRRLRREALLLQISRLLRLQLDLRVPKRAVDGMPWAAGSIYCAEPGKPSLIDL